MAAHTFTRRPLLAALSRLRKREKSLARCTSSRRLPSADAGEEGLFLEGIGGLGAPDDALFSAPNVCL